MDENGSRNGWSQFCSPFNSTGTEKYDRLYNKIQGCPNFALHIGF